MNIKIDFDSTARFLFSSQWQSLRTMQKLLALRISTKQSVYESETNKY